MIKNYSYINKIASKNVSNVAWSGLAMGKIRYSHYLLILIFALVSVNSSTAQTNVCQAATQGSAFAAPTCSNQTKNVYAGQYESMAFLNGVVYTFSIANNGNSNGVCVNNASLGTGSGPFTYKKTGGDGSLNVSAYRNANTWDASSATITYKKATPVATNSSTATIQDGVGHVLSGNNPASVGTGAWTVVSGPSTSSAQFASTTTYNTTFTPAGGTGVYVVRWTVSNSDCTPASANANITVTNQCQTHTASSAFAAATCSNKTKNLAAGQYENLAVTNGYIYRISIANNNQSGGVCIQGVNYGSSAFDYTATTTGNVVVAAYRNSDTWHGTSAVVTYRVKSPTITSQPSAPSTFCEGLGAENISVSATGAGLTYQWRKNGVNLSNGGVFSNVTTASMTITGPAAADAGNYDVVITNSGGCTTTSNAVAVAVTALATPAAITGGGSITCGGTTDLDNANSPGEWVSDDELVATVNSINGIVTGVAGGTANIYFSYDNAGCNSDYATKSVTVDGVPTAVSATAADNPECTESDLTLTGSATSVGALTWAWSGPNSYASTTQSPVISSITAAAAGIYSLVATNACGSAAVATTAAVVVTTLPAATISYAGSPFCISLGAGQPVTETGTAGGVYTAAPGGLTIDAGSGDINPSTSTAGTYTVTYTIAAASGCAQVQATTTVTIKALPAITVQPTDPAPINAGAGSAIFTVGATGGDITYQWQEFISGWLNVTNGGVYSGATTTSLTITNPPGSMNGNKYRCVVSGCAPDATSDGLATMTVNSAGNPTPCYGTTQNYNVTDVPGTTYTWTAPAGWTVSSGQGTNSINFVVGINSGNVEVTPSNDCGDGTARTLAVAVARVDLAASATSICAGTSVTFTATPFNAGAPTYRWKKNGTVISGETNPTYVTTTLANTDAITVEMTSTSGCVINSTPINMIVDIAGITASVAISAEETTICAGISNTFTAIPVNGGTPSYVWKSGGIPIGGETGVTYTTTGLTDTESITCEMTSSFGCVLGSPATSNAIVMSVNTSYVASVTNVASSTAICSGDNVTFTATPTNGGASPSYQWKNGAALVGTNSNTYASTTLADGDNITVLMTPDQGCTTPSPVTSNTETMSVDIPISNNTISASQTICTGANPADLTGSTPANGNGAYTYLWEESTTSSTAGFAPASGTNTTISYITPVLANTTWYRRTVTSAPCASNVSSVVKITVNTAVANNTIGTDQSICSGGTPSELTGSVPTNGNGTYTYLWESAEDAGFTVNLTSVATTQDYWTAPLTVDTWFRRTVTSAPCAANVSATPVKITIVPDLPASVTIAADATNVCAGEEVTFTPTPVNGGTAPSYQWQKNTVDISGEVYSTFSSTSLVDGDDITVLMTSNDGPCLTGSPATSNIETMDIDAIPVVEATNSVQTICSGGSFATMALTTNPVVASTTFAWVRDNGDLASGVVQGLAASGSGDIVAAILTHTLTTTQTVTFTITPTGPAATNCQGDTIIATIDVNPAAPATVGSITGVDSTYEGFTEHYKVDALIPNATAYTWTVPTGWSISSGQGTYLLKTVAGTTGQDGDITVTASNICGTSAATTLAVVIRGASTAANPTPCEGTTERYTTQRRNDVSYRWEVPADWAIQTGAASNSMTTTVGAAAGNITVIEYNSCGDGTAQTFAVTPNPRPVMVSSDSENSCSDVALNIPLVSSVLPATYEWIAADNGITSGENTTTQTTPTIADMITNPGPGSATITYSVIPTATATGCVGTDGDEDPQIITVVINPAGYWTGVVSDRWDVAGNWCGEPSCTADAFIPSVPTGGNFPVIRNPDEVCRDLTISADASLTLDGDGLSVCGDWTNNGDFVPNSEKVTFWASDRNQHIGGNAENYFYDLYIANTGTDSILDSVILAQPVTVTNQLNLSNGVLYTDENNLLTLTNTATNATNGGNGNSGGSGPSFVDGPMRWNALPSGAFTYIFPTGKGGKWARIAISDLDVATDFQAEYFNTAFTNVAEDDLEIAPSATDPLTRISAKEYWHLYRIGAGEGKVKLYWEDADWSAINDCAPGGGLRIGHWDPSNSANNGSTLGSWENNNDAVTPSGTCGGTTSGDVITDGPVTEFSPFTFASTTLFFNPLPVELLFFNATYNGKTVDVSWETATEINNDYFTVERSTDGIHFETISVMIPSKAKGGNSTSLLSYAMNDADVIPGVYYYRLKQTDFNGEFKYSAIDVVEIDGSSVFSFDVSPNPGNGTELYSIINAEKGEEVIVVVYDVLGQEICTQIIVTQQKGNTIYAIDLNHKLSTGVYLITATSDNKIYSKRLVVN